MKDLTHKYVNIKPVNSIINFDKSAYKLSNILFFKIPLIISRPPIKTSKPNETTICINNFFFCLNLIVKIEKIKIGKPKKEGISDVIESLPLMKLIIIPQLIRNKPYKAEKASIFKLKTVYSLLI